MFLLLVPQEQRTAKRERAHVLRNYIVSLGGTVESGHVSSPASFDWTGDPSSMDSSQLDPVRPPGEALKTGLSGWASSPAQSLPMRTESDTPSPGLFDHMPLFTGECESAPESAGDSPTKKLKTDHWGVEEATGGQGAAGATRAGGESTLMRQGSRLNWIKRWAALHPSEQASSVPVADVTSGALPVPVETSCPVQGVPLSDRVTESGRECWP